MLTLDIDLNCMCLFVPQPGSDGTTGSMHVLMPCTHQQEGANKHVARMLFRDRAGRFPHLDLANWSLTVGSAPGTASTTLVPSVPSPEGAVVADLTAPTGRRIDPKLVTQPNRSVISKITFNTGKVTSIRGQLPRWTFLGQPASLAHRVVWRVEVEPEELVWEYFGKGPKPPEPLTSLRSVLPYRRRSRDVYCLHVHHVSEKAFRIRGGLSPRTSVLTAAEVISHFAMFYDLLGIANPAPALLPSIPPQAQPDPSAAKPLGGGTGWACRLAQAQM